jgi:hypothetical protein
MYYGSFLQYCLAILQINEFGSRVYTEGCPWELVEDELYSDVRAELAQFNVSIPPHHFHNAQCNGTSSLERQGLVDADGEVAQFGGLGGYFGILTAYWLVFALLGYGALRWKLSRDSV